MFTIIISEKGGAERRETYDKNEINVGRVQGNDLMLPKGNVSKHHARLLYRDGRFIVTDLKSTNGTYVNGRKISQATIVREGDKIYIGDFVLRLDTGGANAAASEPEGYRDGEPQEAAPPRGPGRLPPPGAPPQDDDSDAPPAAATNAVMAVPPERLNPPGGAGPRVPPAPRVPSSIGNVPAPAAAPPQQQPVGNRTAVLAGGPAAGQRAPVARGGAAPAQPTSQPQQPAPAPPAPAPVIHHAPAVEGARMPSRVPPRESPQQAARRLALLTLVDRIADAVDLSPLKASPIVPEALVPTIERAVREQAKGMRDEGEAPEGTDVESLARDAHRELVGLGAIGPLLEDDDVSEVHVVRPDYVVITRGGVPALAESFFSSDAALERVVHRLALHAGEPLAPGETLIERRLPRGARMTATLPPASTSVALSIVKRRRVDSSLEELVRAGAMSRAMAVFFENCVVARANVLVVASAPALAGGFLSALASVIAPGDRVALLHDDVDVPLSQTYAVTLALPNVQEGGEASVRAAAHLNVDHLLAGPLAGRAAAAVVEAIVDGHDGVLATMTAPTMRQAFARLAAQLTLARPGLSLEAARDCVGESFDVGIELIRSADGRPRVARVTELAGSDGRAVVTKDLFLLGDGGGSGDGAFQPTGAVPRFVTEFAARGVRLDANLFKRR